MPKLFKTKWIFYFVTVFFIIFIVSFFIWDVAGDTLNPKFFTASLTSDSTTLSQDEAPETNLAEFDVVDKQNEVIAIIEEETLQDQLDNIQEKLDIISQQVQALIAEQNHPVIRPDAPSDDGAEPEEVEDLGGEDGEEISETVSCVGQININTASSEDLDKITSIGPVTAQKIIEARTFYSLNDLLKVSGIGETTLQKIIQQGCAYVEPALSGGGGSGGTGGSSVPDVYLSVLISEVQIAGVGDEKQEFVELYNPNNQDVDLTGWYLRKKTSGGNVSYFDKKSLFSGQKILANGYFLIAREGYFVSLADIPTDEALSSNSSLIFNNPNDVISDEISWLQITDGLSWCFNFTTCTPTPKAQNLAYVEPPVPTDMIVPVIVLTGDSEITIAVGDIYIDSGATASDDTDGDVTANIIIVNQVDANIAGDYTITYNVSDAVGNHAVEVTRLVHVAPLSNDATVTSSVYIVSALTDGVGTITNVSFGTPKVTFLNNLTFAVGSLENTTSSSLSDIIVSNDILAVTAQDGTTQATYTITVNEAPPSIVAYTLNGLAQDVLFNPNTASPISIVITASEPVDWVSAKIYKSDDNAIYKNKSPINNGDGTDMTIMTWDGTLTKPTVGSIFDGTYLIKIHIRDLVGNDVDNIILFPYTITVVTTTPE